MLRGLLEVLARYLEGEVNVAETGTRRVRRVLLEEQRPSVQREALATVRLVDPEPGPLVVRLGLRLEPDDLAVEARSLLHVPDDQDDLRVAADEARHSNAFGSASTTSPATSPRCAGPSRAAAP